jgi:mRNA-degrading endonuclease RelE of RelBE toxin-antitoxin system
MFKIELHKDVAHYYKKLNTKTQKKINIAIDEIVKNPFKGPHIKKLKGMLEGKYRYEIVVFESYMI